MSLYVILWHLMTSYVILCHLMSSYVILCHLMSSYVILCPLMSSCDIPFTPLTSLATHSYPQWILQLFGECLSLSLSFFLSNASPRGAFAPKNMQATQKLVYVKKWKVCEFSFNSSSGSSCIIIGLLIWRNFSNHPILNAFFNNFSEILS